MQKEAEDNGSLPRMTVDIPLKGISMHQRQYLELLTVFPSTFDEKGAKAVLELDEVSSLLNSFTHQGLLVHDNVNHKYAIHDAGK